MLASVLAVCGCERQEEPKPVAEASQATSEDPSADPAMPGPKLRGGAAVPSVLCDPGDQTDNASCLVCHVDLTDEVIAAKHLETGIVCAACHGPSEAHRSDELNVITPDVSYGRSEIEPFCKACHPSHKTGEAYEAFVKEWLGRRRPNGRMVLKDSVCTDCHGNHAILRPEQQVSG